MNKRNTKEYNNNSIQTTKQQTKTNAQHTTTPMKIRTITYTHNAKNNNKTQEKRNNTTTPINITTTTYKQQAMNNKQQTNTNEQKQQHQGR